MFGFAFSNSVLSMVLLAIPLGLRAGAVDAELNNFVALNHKSKHMNYLHSFGALAQRLGHSSWQVTGLWIKGGVTAT
ncbi:hypothetical protein HND97_11580 [Vibrio cholerae]|nr:hypothetical protein HND97_11580 [Vibrio cholerae]